MRLFHTLCLGEGTCTCSTQNTEPKERETFIPSFFTVTFFVLGIREERRCCGRLKKGHPVEGMPLIPPWIFSLQMGRAIGPKQQDALSAVAYQQDPLHLQVVPSFFVTFRIFTLSPPL